ncbi:MAG: hypothetical protein Q8S19_08865 [Bacillota bacterium]|nr:hypothetical protein [Bacillota bacterium]
MEMNLLFYLMFAGPFIVILLDIVSAKNATRNQAVIGYAAFALAIISLLYRDSQLFSWIILAPATLGVIYATQRLNGLSSFLVVLPSFSLLCMSLANTMPRLNSPYYRYTEMLYLPQNIATFVVPPLLIWHLWDRLPYTFDGLRKGNWSETGVPLLARHRFLAIIALVSLMTNFFFLTRMTSYKEKLNYQVSTATYTMFSEFDQAAHLLTYRDSEVFEDWQPRVLRHLEAYRSAARRVNQMVVSGGIATNSQFHFLAETLPQGLQGALWQKGTLNPEDFTKLVAVIKAFLEALEMNYRPNNALSPVLYQRVADHVLKAMKDSDALIFFDVQYSPR